MGSHCDPAWSVARLIGYDGGMDENPYKSPLADQTHPQQPAPMWRRIISLPLIVFGALILITNTCGVVIVVFEREDIPPLIVPVYYAVGVALTWVGIWLRRPPRNDS